MSTLHYSVRCIYAWQHLCGQNTDHFQKIMCGLPQVMPQVMPGWTGFWATMHPWTDDTAMDCTQTSGIAQNNYF